MTSKLTDYIGTRIEPRVRVAFAKKATKHGGTSEVLRELVLAFVDDRATITPPKPRKLFVLPLKAKPCPSTLIFPQLLNPSK